MKIDRTRTAMVGMAQSVIAVVVMFACIFYFNSFGIKTFLNEAVEFCYFHLLALLVFGFLSLISGLFLVYEWLESR